MSSRLIPNIIYSSFLFFYASNVMSSSLGSVYRHVLPIAMSLDDCLLCFGCFLLNNNKGYFADYLKKSNSSEAKSAGNLHFVHRIDQILFYETSIFVSEHNFEYFFINFEIWGQSGELSQ